MPTKLQELCQPLKIHLLINVVVTGLFRFYLEHPKYMEMQRISDYGHTYIFLRISLLSPGLSPHPVRSISSSMYQ